MLVEGVATWLLCFFAGEAHAAPLHPPRPRSGIGSGVVVCRVCWWRVMCRKSSPAAAFYGDSRDLICATLATSGEVSPDPSRRRATLAFILCKIIAVFPNHRPTFCFFECQLKKRKAYPKRFEKGSGGAGGGGKNFPQKFFIPPPPNRVCFFIKKEAVAFATAPLQLYKAV